MDEYLELFTKETTLYNQIVLGTLLPEKLWSPLPHFIRGWLRNYIAATLLYLVCNFLWCLYTYNFKRHVYTSKDIMPTRKTMYLHIYVSMKAMPWYCALPTVGEYMVESGWTKCFSRISDVGWASYICYSGLYLIFVEFSIYWMHREVHDIKPLYKWLHAPHHMYNTQNTLSPFAGLALHPLDGILQGLPYVIVLLVVPTHFTTYIGLFAMEAIWTANIHDCIHGNVWPIMGAGYHTIHHTKHRHNYGHYTIWMDWMFGTLRHPLEDEAKNKF
ncbi:hypothetical protein QVD17_06444 [Tagetes erecta]|uniref:Fatty acid hydroxylase domain-containing protein n=1 Tax=Tagetes erecta TaxID=13708 RepID=A0AAD8LDQ9_TARER|nr:hypothetical protein QVD17_06444 [Tagetes erecta]